MVALAHKNEEPASAVFIMPLQYFSCFLFFRTVNKCTNRAIDQSINLHITGVYSCCAYYKYRILGHICALARISIALKKAKKY